MTTASELSTRSVRATVVDELSEDLDVAIREFLERHPHTSRRRIRQAIRLVERQAIAGPLHRVTPAVALLAAFAAGMAFGLTLG